MHILTDMLPCYCPRCGHPGSADTFNPVDWCSGITVTCARCGAGARYMRTNDLFDAAVFISDRNNALRRANTQN